MPTCPRIKSYNCKLLTTALWGLFACFAIYGLYSTANHSAQNESRYFHNYISKHSDKDQNDYNRENAALVFLARNSELYQVLGSMQQLEDKFNQKYRYPYIFLNDKPFTDDFINLTSTITASKCSYGLIAKEHWNPPSHINKTRAEEVRKTAKYKYGDSLSYRNMCRFNSGFIYRHPLLQNLRYYWRVEPSVEYPCMIDYDPFKFMKENNKTYGFTVAINEHKATIQSLWPTVRTFIESYPQYVSTNNLESLMIKNDRTYYPGCHFWSNFEIVDLEFYRSEAYTKYFEYLDNAGGFYYERWGDAPVHTLAVSLFQSRDKVHLFEDIGYTHDGLTVCPRQKDIWEKKKCVCNPTRSLDLELFSCMNDFRSSYFYDKETKFV